MGHSVVYTTSTAYARAIEKRGGRPFVKEFSADYYAFEGSRGSKFTARFRVILDADRGDEANLVVRDVYNHLTRGLIPRISTRVGYNPMFMGYSDLRRGGWVKVHYVDDSFDARGHS